MTMSFEKTLSKNKKIKNIQGKEIFMALFMEELKETLSYYEEKADLYKNQYLHSIDGKLIYQKDPDGRVQFMRTVNENGIRKRFGINKKDDELRALAKKEFAAKALKILESNIKILRKAIEKMKPFDLDEILNSMTKAYSMLPEDYFFDRNRLTIDLQLDDETQARIDRHKEWGKEHYNENWYHPENKKHRTSDGKYTRSKAEQLIYESLLNYGIPFHYDEEREEKGLFVVADFTFRGGDMKLFFWEHLGMMDDSKYAKRNFRKLNDYYDVEIIPGENLILTFSPGDNINMGVIKAVILNEVIPRL